MTTDGYAEDGDQCRGGSTLVPQRHKLGDDATSFTPSRLVCLWNMKQAKASGRYLIRSSICSVCSRSFSLSLPFPEPACPSSTFFSFVSESAVSSREKKPKKNLLLELVPNSMISHLLTRWDEKLNSNWKLRERRKGWSDEASNTWEREILTRFSPTV